MESTIVMPKISLPQYLCPVCEKTHLAGPVNLYCVCMRADLRKCEERGELLLPVLFFLLVVLSVLLYFAVSLMDPGFVLSDTVKVRLANKTPTHNKKTGRNRLHKRWIGISDSGFPPAYKITLFFQSFDISVVSSSNNATFTNFNQVLSSKITFVKSVEVMVTCDEKNVI